MLAGATGTLNITDIFNAIASAHPPAGFGFGLVFIVAGLAFKLGQFLPHVGSRRIPGRSNGHHLVRGGAKLAALWNDDASVGRRGPDPWPLIGKICC